MNIGNTNPSLTANSYWDLQRNIESRDTTVNDLPEVIWTELLQRSTLRASAIPNNNDCKTHLPLEKMAVISQTTFLNAFSWIKILEFDLIFTEIYS